MPFIPLVNLAKFKNNKDTPKIGKVINNLDPQRLGRIKIHLPGIYEPQDEQGTNLPWIAKIPDSFLSGSTNSEFFNVPQIGSLVEVVWPYGNKFGFYKSAPYSIQSRTNEFTDNYPYESGLKLGDLVVKFDEGTKSVLITNKKGFKITADATGDVTISGARITIQSDFDLDIEAPNVNIDGNLSVSGSMESAEGASGNITLASIASVVGGVVTSIE